MDLADAHGLLRGRIVGYETQTAYGRLLLCGWLLLKSRGAYTKAISEFRRLSRRGTTAADLLRGKETRQLGLMGVALDFLLYREAGALLELIDDLDDFLKDEIRESYILGAAGEIDTDGVVTALEELAKKERRLDCRVLLRDLGSRSIVIKNIGDAVREWIETTAPGALPEKEFSSEEELDTWKELGRVWTGAGLDNTNGD
jgi:hypothetical protein